MDIVCNIDNGYVKYCIVMLTSLFVNNPEETFHIHIIAGELSEEARHQLTDMVEREYKQQLSLYLVGEEVLASCPIDHENYISISTYYRCFITDILPRTLSKVLYLDCDLIVHGSIRELWETDLQGYAVGVVEDMWSGKPEHYSRLDYPEEFSYFNAGVMLVNMDYWREHHIGEQVAEYINRYPERLLYNDQDALNAVLYKQRLFIPFRWNMQDGFFRKKRKLRPVSVPALEKEMGQAAIIHFTGGKKPWNDKCVHPYKKTYFRYLDMTRWKGERPPVNYLFRLNNLSMQFQGWLGLKNVYRKTKVA